MGDVPQPRIVKQEMVGRKVQEVSQGECRSCCVGVMSGEALVGEQERCLMDMVRLHGSDGPLSLSLSLSLPLPLFMSYTNARERL